MSYTCPSYNAAAGKPMLILIKANNYLTGGAAEKPNSLLRPTHAGPIAPDMIRSLIISVTTIAFCRILAFMSKIDLRPVSVSLGVAGRLLGFIPPSAINHYRQSHPAEFANSTDRRIAMADIDASPRRRSPPTVAEILKADRACEDDRARFRFYNSSRKDGANANVN
jgi:hypothetical protein